MSLYGQSGAVLSVHVGRHLQIVNGTCISYYACAGMLIYISGLVKKEGREREREREREWERVGVREGSNNGLIRNVC